MPDDAHVAGGQPELRAELVGRTIVVESHHQHRALAFREPADNVGGGRHRRSASAASSGLEVERERIEQPRAAPVIAPRVDDQLPRGAEHERGDLFRLAHRAGAQLVQHQDQHVLHEVRGRGFAAQALEAKQADARRETPAEVRLGVGSRAAAAMIRRASATSSSSVSSGGCTGGA